MTHIAMLKQFLLFLGFFYNIQSWTTSSFVEDK